MRILHLPLFLLVTTLAPCQTTANREVAVAIAKIKAIDKTEGVKS